MWRKPLCEPMHVNRREVLSGIASAAVGIGGTTIFLEQSTGTAEASVSMGTLNIDGDDKTTRDGTISDVVASLSGQWSYDVPGSKDPQKWQVVLWTKRNGEKEPVGVSEGQAKYLSNSGSYSLEGSLISSDLWSVGDFEEGTDGETKTTDVGLLLVFNVFDPNETVIAQSKLETTATVEVTNNGYEVTQHGKVSSS